MQVGDPTHLVFEVNGQPRCVDFLWDIDLGQYVSVGQAQTGYIYWVPPESGSFGAPGFWQLEIAGNFIEGSLDETDPTGAYGPDYVLHWGTCNDSGESGISGSDSDSGHSDASGSGWIPESSLSSSSECSPCPCICIVLCVDEPEAQGTYCHDGDGIYQFTNGTTGDQYSLQYNGSAWTLDNETQVTEIDDNIGEPDPCNPEVSNAFFIIVCGTCDSIPTGVSSSGSSSVSSPSESSPSSSVSESVVDSPSESSPSSSSPSESESSPSVSSSSPSLPYVSVESSSPSSSFSSSSVVSSSLKSSSISGSVSESMSVSSSAPGSSSSDSV